MTRSSRPPPTLEELRRRRAQLAHVLSTASELEDRNLLERQLEELDDTIARTTATPRTSEQRTV